MPEQISVPRTPTEPAPVTGPVLPRERIEVIDILRGWAVFGIILADVDITHRILTPTDRAVEHLHILFVVDKFWPLFSFLFGLGFALQMLRAQARGVSFLRFFSRRLLVLLLFGVANCMLFLHLFRGDVIHIYALLGFVLLLFRHSSPRTILLAAFAFLLIPPLYDAAIEAARERRLTDPRTAPQMVAQLGQQQAERMAWRQRNRQAQSQGTYSELTTLTARNFLHWHARWDGYDWWVRGIFPMFLLGLYVGRRRILEKIPAHLPFIRKVFWWGMGLGLVSQSVRFFTENSPDPAWPLFTHLATSLFTAFGNPALSFGYASAIILLLQTERWRTQLAPLAAAGRMALSNYLFQSTFFVLFVPAYGLGLVQKVPPLAAAGVAFLIFAAELALSVWWMRRFRFGLLEWLWRTLTYGRIQPMRLAAAG